MKDEKVLIKKILELLNGISVYDAEFVLYHAKDELLKNTIVVTNPK